jgi:acyl-CoA thioesterase-1
MFFPFQARIEVRIQARHRALRPYGEELQRFNVLLIVILLYCILNTVALASSDQPRILALGDSLTAGYGLSQSDSFPVQLARNLRDTKVFATIVNAGVSGDTTSGALRRLDWLMDGPYDLAIVELGANDALRAIDPALTRENLDRIVTKLKALGIPVLLAGMKAPRNLGPDYANQFDQIFSDLARKHSVHFSLTASSPNPRSIKQMACIQTQKELQSSPNVWCRSSSKRSERNPSEQSNRFSCRPCQCP